MFSLTSILVY